MCGLCLVINGSVGNTQDKCDTLSLWVHTKFCVKLEASFTNKLLVISLAARVFLKLEEHELLQTKENAQKRV